MAKKHQHFVPRVYMKAWETKVETIKEPTKKFDGVYSFETVSDYGNGTNRDSIMWKPHLYTVNFKYNFIFKSCPKIYTDFVDQIYDLMINNEPNPVYAKYGYINIKTKQSVRKHIFDVLDWEFFYRDGNAARQNAILNKIQSLNCYILENGFDDVFEKRWEAVYSNFINEVHNGQPIAIGQSERQISSKSAVDMLDFFFMFLCRSPYFTAMGIYKQIKETFLQPIFKEIIKSITNDDIENPSEKTQNYLSEANLYADEMMTGVWYSELYKILFKQSGGFYHNIFKKAIDGCQMILFETYPDSEHFITSDNPAFEHKNLISRNNENGFIFPLTPNHLLFIAKGSDKINIVDHRYANTEVVRHFNRIIAHHKKQLLIANIKHINI